MGEITSPSIRVSTKGNRGYRLALANERRPGFGVVDRLDAFGRAIPLLRRTEALWHQ